MVIHEVPLWLYGSGNQKQKYLPRLCSGEWIGSFGLTEPNAGSDAGSIATTARHEGNYYVLNGSKIFITNGPIADLVLAMTDKARGTKGISSFLVEKGFPGFSVARELSKMGHRGSPTGELIFEDCRVPVENLLGRKTKAILPP